MAAQCLIQAIGGEGYVYIKGYGDLKFFEPFVIESEEHLNLVNYYPRSQHLMI